jgi:alginate O-acetyltransferase complex protein AlgI
VLFNSQVFLYLFLPAVLAGYHLAPWALRRGGPANAFLFAASVAFYAWGEGRFVGVLLGSLAVNYAAARLIAAAHDRDRSGKGVLVAAVLFDLGLLVGFKYTPFLAANLSAAWQWLGGSPFAVPDTHLPIGVSFFTFQAISYVLDVHRREVPAERGFVRFGLYVFLFPHLIAGPIVRYRDLAGPLADRTVDAGLFASGVRRFVAGLAKKALLADTLAVAADAVFKLPPGDLSPSAAWLGMLAYTLQIYFDFSGYSDMAIGLGRMFGFRFAENFRHPYAAASVTEFWRRWHVSLSSWFRDYVYVPLGGNRGGRWRTYRNLLVVFLLCGVWHGANWTFVAWGLWHGLFLVAERAGLGSLLDRLPPPARHAYTLLAVLVGWAIFRSETLPQAGAVVAALGGFAGGSWVAADFLTGQVLTALLVGSVASLPVVPWLRERWADRPLWEPAVGLAAVSVLLPASAVWLAGNTFAGFIYFRF